MKTRLRQFVTKANTGADAIKRAPIVDYDTGVRCLRTSDIANNNPFDQWGFCEVSDKYHRQYSLIEGDIIIARTGPIGKSYFVRSDIGAVYNNGLMRIRVNETDVFPQFVFYCLRAKHFEDYIKQVGSCSATRPNIKMDIVLDYEIEKPSMSDQRKIAAILSTYDDLIENNTSRIRILGEMARSIYHEWFVNFSPPIHDKVRIIASELGLIPEGWKIKKLGDVLKTIESGSRPKGGASPNGGEVPSIGAENIIGLGKYEYSKDKYVSRSFFESMRKGWIRDKDVLLYKDGAQIGRKTMFQSSFPHSECCINEHVFILQTNQLCTQNYLYFWLDQPDMTQNIKNLNANAAQPGINQAGVKSLPILLPPQELLEKFDDVVEPLLGELFNLAKKNSVLYRTRDLLLPRLISGGIDVSDVDIDIGEEAA